ncbi:MAG: carboxypeptidase regulatory-like domain-containing protein [Deltaproteobacteria bacterium]|nr:MAG: carboxypeptidase regulatory-like domain-containing protein [Deltaproteobacteria bacterium]
MSRSVMSLVLMVPLVSCGTEEEPIFSAQGACGPVTEHVLTLHVRVVDASGEPAEGATVTLEERNYLRETLGSGLSDALGEASLADLDITSVEGCWGVALDYVVVATLEERQAEARINPSLFNAVQHGEAEVDRRDRPLTLP